jgi:hypothetical protein
LLSAWPGPSRGCGNDRWTDCPSGVPVCTAEDMGSPVGAGAPELHERVIRPTIPVSDGTPCHINLAPCSHRIWFGSSSRVKHSGVGRISERDDARHAGASGRSQRKKSRQNPLAWRYVLLENDLLRPNRVTPEIRHVVHATPRPVSQIPVPSASDVSDVSSEAKWHGCGAKANLSQIPMTADWIGMASEQDIGMRAGEGNRTLVLSLGKSSQPTRRTSTN